MKKTLLLLFLAFVLVLAGCGTSKQTASQNEETPEKNDSLDDYPKKPINVIIPYEPGGSTDTTARILASAVTKYLPNDAQVVMVNKPGGASTVGLTEVANSEPDGYTIGVMTNTPLTIKPHTDDLAYDYDDFEPLIKLVSIPQMLYVKKDAPWNTFEELADWIKENPGKFKYGITGVGTTAHLIMENFLSENNLKAEAIPYQGGGPVAQAVLGDNVHGGITFAGVPDEDQVKFLVDFSDKRSEGWSDVPTINELFDTFSVSTYIGLVAPKATPKEIVQLLHDAFKQALEDPEVVEKLNNQGLTNAYENSEDFSKSIEEEYNRNEKILGDLGLLK